MTLEKLIKEQHRLLNDFFEQFDQEKGEELVELLYKRDGIIFFTGVGKSGFIAQKIAATLMSTGTKAFFLPPIDALHGDLGMVSSADTVCLVSKSGETEELLHLLPNLRNKGSWLVAITSSSASRLAKGADFSLTLPCEKELCPFDLAPTTSTEVQLLFGDLLAMRMMEIKNFSIESYAKNHPGGQIGKRASLKVKDFMLDSVKAPFCSPDKKLADVLEEFTDKQCGCMIVVDEKKQLQGIFTDGDLRRALQIKGRSVLQETIASLMTRKPKAIHDDELAWDAVQMMESDQKHPVMVLPVLERERSEVVGVIKMHDLIQANL